MSRKRPRSAISNLEENSSGSIEQETRIGPAPFCHDDEAIKERQSIDYSLKITTEMAQANKAPRPVRVYADGIYDMFHSGHARQLMQAKACFPNVYLIVGVCDNELTLKMKGRTVMDEGERYESIRHCRYVDELVPNAPWTLDDEFLDHHKIDFVAHDDLPYGAGSDDDIYKWLKDRGMFVATQRTEGISTTDVIARIIKDYDMYVRRNLARGVSAKDLNVSYMKEQRLKLQEKVDKIREKLDDKRTAYIEKGHEVFHKWEERSREFITNFLELFGREGKINKWIVDSRAKVARAISPSIDDMEMFREDSPTASTSDTYRPSSVSPPPAKRSRRDLLDLRDSDDEAE